MKYFILDIESNKAHIGVGESFKYTTEISDIQNGDVVLGYSDKLVNSCYFIDDVDLPRKTITLKKHMEKLEGINIDSLIQNYKINVSSNNLEALDNLCGYTVMYRLYCNFPYKKERQITIDQYERLSVKEREELFLRWYNNSKSKLYCFDCLEFCNVLDQDFRVSSLVEVTSNEIIGRLKDRFSSKNWRRGRELHKKSNSDTFIESGYILTTITNYEKFISSMINKPIQRIIYGAPGTGKSYSIDSEIAKHLGIEAEYKNDGKTAFEGKCKIFRTTFHPDYDYAQFVGCYKPTEGAKDTNGNVTITYKFVPEVFMDAYVYAWNTGLPVYLIIEEINRGNCAQIFGDLFQLLDRNDYGESEYSIKPNTDIKNYLLSGGENDEAILMESEGIANGLRLPSNLNIIATMNTSDQSLFPMDSAFKRRWDWKYEPICYENKVNGKDKNIMIIIEDNNGEHKFKWNDFQRAVNYQILKVTSSEDKQMGDWFIKDDIRTDQFVSKVMFYLWNDVCKENYGTNDNFFRTGSDKESQFTYGTLANETLRGDTLVNFMSYLRDSFIKDDEAKKTLTQDNADSFLKEIQ